MKTIIILLFLMPILLSAQTNYEYTYDGAGNRIMRQIPYPKKPETQLQKLASYTIKVFPNPADKILNIDITGLEKATKIKVELLDLRGTKVYENENAGTSLQVPLTDYTNGAYLLNIYIGDKRSYWKIIKEE